MKSVCSTPRISLLTEIVPVPADQQVTMDKLSAAIKAAKQAIPAADGKNDDLRKSLQQAVKGLEDSKQRFRNRFGRVMIMRELESPRETHLQIRGDFLRPGELVVSDVPAVLPALPQQDGRHQRLDLARWLVDVRHPLTARVTGCKNSA